MKRKTMLAATMVALLAALLLVATAPQSAQAHPSTFPDVTETDPAHDAIESLAARQIVAGTTSGEFQPYAFLTRGQATKILVNWRGEDTIPATSSRFSDVDSTYAPYVEVALAKGWVGGYPDGTFRPWAAMTREQMAVVLMRSLGLQAEALALDQVAIAGILGPFVDDSLVSASARPYLALAVTKGVFAGDDGLLRPLSAVTRAQFSLVLHRADSLADGLATTVPEESVSVREPSRTAEEQALAAFMDEYLFRPHSSPVTGNMVLDNAERCGIPPLPQLVIMAAETSLGDPKLGGALVRSNNFGCMRYHGAGTLWGMLSSGRIWVAGKDWYAFATPQIGMAAWGLYLASAMDGFYLPILRAADLDWERFAAVYYGRGVSGFSGYVGRLQTLENRFRQVATEHGVSF